MGWRFLLQNRIALFLKSPAHEWHFFRNLQLTIRSFAKIFSNQVTHFPEPSAHDLLFFENPQLLSRSFSGMLSCRIDFFKNLQLMTRAFFGNLRIGPEDSDCAMEIEWGLAASAPSRKRTATAPEICPYISPIVRDRNQGDYNVLFAKIHQN